MLKKCFLSMLLMLSMVMLMVSPATAVAASADAASEYNVDGSSIATVTFKDYIDSDSYNTYSVSYCGTVSGSFGWVYTEAVLTHYAGGVTSSVKGIKITPSTDATVYFYSTSANKTDLDTSDYLTGAEKGTIIKASVSKTFTEAISVIDCIHQVKSSTGNSVSSTKFYY